MTLFFEPLEGFVCRESLPVVVPRANYAPDAFIPFARRDLHGHSRGKRNAKREAWNKVMWAAERNVFRNCKTIDEGVGGIPTYLKFYRGCEVPERLALCAAIEEIKGSGQKSVYLGTDVMSIGVRN